VNFEEIIRALNEMKYGGPLSVEWEDAAMDREAGAQESVDFVKQIDFLPSDRLFDEAFSSD
jgi:sugar phosphate isomerase/epimerase